MKTLPLLFLVLIAISSRAAEPTLKQSAVIPLPGVKGRIDHMSIDAAGHRLFVAALGNDSVEVIDLAAGKVAQSLKEPKEPQGVKYIPDLKLLAIASGSDGKCRIYDENLQLRNTIDHL